MWIQVEGGSQMVWEMCSSEILEVSRKVVFLFFLLDPFLHVKSTLLHPTDLNNKDDYLHHFTAAIFYGVGSIFRKATGRVVWESFKNY